MMTPFRISLTETNCCVALAGFVAILDLKSSRRMWRLFCGDGTTPGRDVERPRKFRELAAGELRRTEWHLRGYFSGRRCGGRVGYLLGRGLLMLPEEEFRAGIIIKDRLE